MGYSLGFKGMVHTLIFSPTARISESLGLQVDRRNSLVVAPPDDNGMT